MKKGNRVLNEKDVVNIEELLNEGVDESVIIDIMQISKTTLNRIKNKQHYIQREPVSEVKTETKVNTTLDEKLDCIIRLLVEILNCWR